MLQVFRRPYSVDGSLKLRMVKVYIFDSAGIFRVLTNWCRNLDSRRSLSLSLSLSRLPDSGCSIHNSSIFFFLFFFVIALDWHETKISGIFWAAIVFLLIWQL